MRRFLLSSLLVVSALFVCGCGDDGKPKPPITNANTPAPQDSGADKAAGKARPAPPPK